MIHPCCSPCKASSACALILSCTLITSLFFLFKVRWPQKVFEGGIQKIGVWNFSLLSLSVIATIAMGTFYWICEDQGHINLKTTLK